VDGGMREDEKLNGRWGIEKIGESGAKTKK
jgi:hypothetical protein